MMLLKKEAYQVNFKNIEDEIPDITNWATNTTLHAQINEIKREIPSITNFAITGDFNAKIFEVKCKIPNKFNLAICSYYCWK